MHLTPFLIALLSALPVAANAAERVDLLIRHAAVVDVAAGKTTPDRMIAVRGGTIIAVEADARAGRYIAGRTVDATSRFVIPGLWDMHVHFGGGPELVEENRNLLPLYIAAGVTTVRDCSGDLAEQVLAWRGEIAEGRLFGPRIFTSGPKIEGVKPVWKGVLEAGSADEVRAALDRLKALKVDFVKITDNTLKPELFPVALTEAKARGLKSSAHIPMSITVDQAVDQGLGSIEHLDYAMKAGSAREAEISAAYAAKTITYGEAFDQYAASFDAKLAEAAYRKMAAHGVAVTPTLHVSRILAYLDRDDHSGDAYLRYIGPGLRASYDWRVQRATKADAAQIAARHRVHERTASVLPLLQRAGVTILAGTDAGILNSFDYPGPALHEELAIFVEQGLTPREALAASVINGPAFLGQSEGYGAVAPGKVADLLILDADPLRDIGAVRKVRGVAVRGAYQDRAALDAMLETAAAKAGTR